MCIALSRCVVVGPAAEASRLCKASLLLCLLPLIGACFPSRRFILPPASLTWFRSRNGVLTIREEGRGKRENWMLSTDENMATKGNFRGRESYSLEYWH
jgi:hypothetical protein